MYINITSLNRETEWREYMTTKKQNIAVIAVFLCMVFGMTIWTMVTPSREFSERENRAVPDAGWLDQCKDCDREGNF